MHDLKNNGDLHFLWIFLTIANSCDLENLNFSFHYIKSALQTIQNIFLGSIFKKVLSKNKTSGPTDLLKLYTCFCKTLLLDFFTTGSETDINSTCIKPFYSLCNLTGILFSFSFVNQFKTFKCNFSNGL